MIRILLPNGPRMRLPQVKVMKNMKLSLPQPGTRDLV